MRVRNLALMVFTVFLCWQLRASDVERSLLAIQDAIQAGNLSTASVLLSACLKQYPAEGGLYNLRGIIHAQQNELAEARADFEEAVRLAPRLTAAWQNLARACQIQMASIPSSAPCAMQSWQRVLLLDPANPEAHSSVARLYEADGKFAQSLHELALLPSTEGAQTPDLLLRCADLAALGNASQASRLATELASRADFSDADWAIAREAFNVASSASVVVPLALSLDARHVTGVFTLQSLAIAYEHLGRIPDARSTLERVAGLDPKNPAHLIELARLAELTKDHEGALGYLAHARDLTPKDPQVHFLIGEVAVEMKLSVEARKSLGQALALDPGNPTYNYAMGFVILSTRDAASAANYFEKFVAANPREAKGHYALGIAYFASGDYAKSKEQMARVEADPKTAGGAEYFLGRIARRENDLSGSIAHLQRSIELLPDFSESHTELARVYLAQGKLADAKAELVKAVHLDPQSFQANEQLLVLYRRSHDPEAAAQADLVKKLDEARSKNAELMLRTVEFRP